MLEIPAGLRPRQAVDAVCQGSGINRYLLIANPDGRLTCSRYGTTSLIAIPSGSWLTLDATWVIDV